MSARKTERPRQTPVDDVYGTEIPLERISRLVRSPPGGGARGHPQRQRNAPARGASFTSSAFARLGASPRARDRFVQVPSSRASATRPRSALAAGSRDGRGRSAASLANVPSPLAVTTPDFARARRHGTSYSGHVRISWVFWDPTGEYARDPSARSGPTAYPSTQAASVSAAVCNARWMEDTAAIPCGALLVARPREPAAWRPDEAAARRPLPRDERYAEEPSRGRRRPPSFPSDGTIPGRTRRRHGDAGAGTPPRNPTSPPVTPGPLLVERPPPADACLHRPGGLRVRARLLLILVDFGRECSWTTFATFKVRVTALSSELARGW